MDWKAEFDWKDDCVGPKGQLVGEQQFFVGPELLIAPVFRLGQRTKKIFLPPGPEDSPWEWRGIPLGGISSTEKNVLPDGVVSLGYLPTFSPRALGHSDGYMIVVESPLEVIPIFYRVDSHAKYRDLIEAAYLGDVQKQQEGEASNVILFCMCS